MAESEAALAARALAAKSGAATTAERGEISDGDVVDASDEWVSDRISRTSSPRSAFVVVLGGVAGAGLLVLLVISVLTVSDDAKRPVVETEQAPSTSAAPTRAVSTAPTTATVPRIAAPEPAELPPSEVPTAQNQPTVQVMAPQAPLTAETMRPESPPAPPSQMFPRLHRWFPQLFPGG